MAAVGILLNPNAKFLPQKLIGLYAPDSVPVNSPSSQEKVVFLVIKHVYTIFCK